MKYVANTLIVLGLLYLFWFGGDSQSPYVVTHLIIGAIIEVTGLVVAICLYLRRCKSKKRVN